MSTQEEVVRLGMEPYYILLFVCRLLLYVNSSINPILYNLISCKFRAAFCRILHLDLRTRALLTNKNSSLQARDSCFSDRFSNTIDRTTSGTGAPTPSPPVVVVTTTTNNATTVATPKHVAVTRIGSLNSHFISRLDPESGYSTIVTTTLDSPSVHCVNENNNIATNNTLSSLSSKRMRKRLAVPFDVHSLWHTSKDTLTLIIMV